MFIHLEICLIFCVQKIIIAILTTVNCEQQPGSPKRKPRLSTLSARTNTSRTVSVLIPMVQFNRRRRDQVLSVIVHASLTSPLPFRGWHI